MADGHSGVVRVYDEVGDLVRTFGRPGRGPGEFARLSAAAMTADGRLCAASPPEPVDAGRFSSPSARYDLADWLETMTVISGLFVLGDTVLVVAQGRYRPVVTDPPPRFFQIHPATMDLYRLTGELMAEGIPLPGNPLYADSLLYVLEETPPAGWTIVGYRFHARPATP